MLGRLAMMRGLATVAGPAQIILTHGKLPAAGCCRRSGERNYYSV
ncbi:hypothetical protein V441_02600 [Pseudomonas aeruginosa DHS29]|nr:hypothetical protein PADK2_02655 [Pseudomonas aeruginosa DK2]AGO43056.1 hypothetical protein M062_02640 [Pseudomonas aeruginosa RP73]AHB53786.1 hypothetical protein U769_02690 [Pseudomonas aeruginosa MTB-1]AHH47500.1 hypothetical protein AI22_01240 [Pseudomonas aeruginosa YL84]AOX24670.1 hypothetical protein PA1088_00538 [Pseudomonas aeruginosa]EME93625.1 hypothetical protein H123_13905 [Pseudomonas aeruginosa PA21_ST175]ENH89640.1 hypothetical protein H734_29737 [Pseudomonas aeruginosa PA